MSATISCAPKCCDTPVAVNVPGNIGDTGAAGVNAFTTTTADFVIPADEANVTVQVVNSTWMVSGQKVVLPGPAHFEVVSKPTAASVILKFKDYEGDTASGGTIVSGAAVSPSGTQPALAGALPGDFTDNSTGTGSNTIAAGVGGTTLTFPIQLAAMTTAAADLMTNYVVGYAFKILSVSFVTTTIGAGAGASQVLNLEIGSTNVTGGVVTVTLAGTDTLGELTAGTAVTAANVGTATDTLSVEVATAGTVFTAGSGILLVQVQNMDTANAAASFAAHIDALVVALA